MTCCKCGMEIKDQRGYTREFLIVYRETKRDIHYRYPVALQTTTRTVRSDGKTIKLSLCGGCFDARVKESDIRKFSEADVGDIIISVWTPANKNAAPNNLYTLESASEEPFLTELGEYAPKTASKFIRKYKIKSKDGKAIFDMYYK